MDTLYLVMPAYNEGPNIERVVREWYPILAQASDDSRMVVADSGSVDETHEILEKLQTEFPGLEILSDTDRQHGPKLMSLYALAISRGADYIFQTDSDGQTDPGEFAMFWERREKYAAILGNRTSRGDGAQRAFVERVVCTLLRATFGVKVPDANAPFRLMRADVVAAYLDRLPADYALPNIMLTTYFVYYKEHVLFREISFRPRAAGESSINIPRIVGIGWQAIKDFQGFRREMKKRNA